MTSIQTKAGLAPAAPGRKDAHYRHLFERAADGLMVVDASSGRIIEVNPCLAQLLGYAPDELTGRVLWSAGLFADAAAVRAVRAALRRQRSLRHDDLPMQCRDGRRIDVDFLTSPIHAGDADLILCSVRDVTARMSALADLQRAATTDCLTGVANRWHFMETARTELKRTRRYARPLSLAMLDADRFKRINDRYGHAFGDRALCAIAQACRGAVRGADLFGRLGGEAFAVLMPETPLGAALEVAQRLLLAVRGTRLRHEDLGDARVTLSIGIATMDEDGITIDALLAAADERMYVAKISGGDQVCPLPGLGGGASAGYAGRASPRGPAASDRSRRP